MIRYPLWKLLFILAICVLGIAYAVPNLMSKEQAAAWQAKVPSWLPSKTVSLGLDLQGGSHLMLQVGIDVAIRDQAENAMQSAREELRTEKLGYTSLRATPNGFIITPRTGTDPEAMRRAVLKDDPTLDVTAAPDSVTVTFSEAKMIELTNHIIDQSIEIVRRRVDETGTREPVIARQGTDRIVVQLPGVKDPEGVKKLIGTTAKLGLHLVDLEATRVGRAGVGKVQLPSQEDASINYVVEKRPMITGDMLTTAQPSFGQSGNPVVTFNLNGIGARRFCDASTKNVNKPFAIVLDDVIVSAPTIQEPICGGTAQISGQFSVKETSDLALLLRAGALPAPLKIVEERTVGPTLGSDSIEAGKKACLIGLLFVIVFVTSVYGLFGIFASLALIINVTLIMGGLSMLQATLTLPGIAGIVLAIGLAVDGNVLVYERIKEELRAGRSPMAAIDVGYQRARTTIMDSNLTTLISALILFSFGTGPIKGFAVTTTIGVITSYFCALMLTHAMVMIWLRWAKPKAIEG